MSFIIPVLTFLFLFSIMALIRLVFNFLRALLSTPPKPFELMVHEVAIYGIFLSYIITYLIHL
jgi:hypothetical protein